MAEFPGGPVTLVMFDLDGTLVDTVPDIAVALNAALEDLQLPVVSEADVRHWVGNGARTLCGRAIVHDMNDTADPALVDDLLARFLERYAERVCVETRVFDGVSECLEDLCGRGVSLACVTNKPERHTRALLDALGIFRYFDVVVAGDTLGEKKPAPAPLRHVMASAGMSPMSALMVGDSATDIKAARAAGVRSVCVTYGYNHGEDVHALGADAVVESLHDLPGLLMSPAYGTQESS